MKYAGLINLFTLDIVERFASCFNKKGEMFINSVSEVVLQIMLKYLLEIRDISLWLSKQRRSEQVNSEVIRKYGKKTWKMA
ncbi:CLUMA_CG006639, isoform A [Clunio marinus]|uniref:CLUMA_CG006639, isoform A n=1 Tax=Clunio marinus TaxID=568069 RepID=A0A1J1HZK9_9DIPT|nr:CLUMA_CG006639, isoform A [Clunio marinus]